MPNCERPREERQCRYREFSCRLDCLQRAATGCQNRAMSRSQTVPAVRSALSTTSLAALGVVFGDIGTSPLYTLKTVLDLMGQHDAQAVFGALSLIVWTLVVITSVKYVGFAMRVDNDGEGGIMALMSLLGLKQRSRPIIVAFGLFSLLSAYSHSPEQLVWARAAMGLGAAAVMPQTLSIISNVFEPAERPKAIGIWAVAVGIGIAIGPIVGGLLLAHFWWGSVFLLNMPFTAAGAAAVWLIVPESKNPDPGRIDYVGVLASITGLVLLVYGIIRGGDAASWLNRGVLLPIAGGLAVLAVFVWHEGRTAHPSGLTRRSPTRSPRASSRSGWPPVCFTIGALARACTSTCRRSKPPSTR